MNTRNSLKLDNAKYSKTFLIDLYNQYTGRNNKGLNLSNISTKYNPIRAVLNWVATIEGTGEKFQQKLKFVCESLDIQDVFDCFDKLEKWCGYRNEIIHGLMNKNMDSLYSELALRAEEGMRLATRIDSYVAVVKKGHIIRKSINLNID